jgi:predicted TIM-barrel fold metal-dependent hydrolase
MIELFDAQAGFGGGRRGQPWVPSVDELLERMETLSIARALVRTDFEEMDSHPMYSNEVLYKASEEHPSLVPCPTVLPTGHGDVPSEQDQIAELTGRGGGAAVLRPGHDGWSTAEWCAGALLGLLEDRRIPVLCRNSAFEFDSVADLAGRHPKLPIVMFHVGFRSQRALVSLMKAFPNVHLAIGSPFSVHLAIELMSRDLGAGRLLFGTGFPYAEPMASITMLTYSELSAEDKQRVGVGNLDRLIGGIRG